MHTISSTPEFFQLTEAEITIKLDEFEESDAEATLASDTDPVIAEIIRLVEAYSNRFDELSASGEEDLDDILDYSPQYPIEEVAFELFLEALHETLQDIDEN